MTLTLRIEGWQARGLRCPDHQVDLSLAEGIYPISLIQMPNGTGKTTTLRLLRAALSGSLDRDGAARDDIEALARRRGMESEGEFRLRLRCNDQPVTITLRFDFDRGEVKYLTTLPSGQKPGFHPPAGFERFLRPEFVEFFLFDGELAEHLLSARHTDAQTAIEDLFYLGTFAKIRGRVEDFWKEEIERRGASEKKGLIRRQNRVHKLELRLRQMEEEQRDLQQELASVIARQADREERFQDALAQREDDQRRVQEAVTEARQTEAELGDVSRSVLERMRHPQSLAVSFARKIRQLKLSFDRVKLPESAAREFFEELAEEPDCVCGRPLDTETREKLRQRARHYFGSEEVAMLNSMKTAIADQIPSEEDEPSQELDALLNTLKQARAAADRAKTQLDVVRVDVASGDPAREATLEEIKELTAHRRELERDLQKYEDTSTSAGDESTGIQVLRRRLEHAENDLAEITDTLNLKTKKEVLVNLLETIVTRARENLGAGICADTNERIHRLMPENRIRIREIDRCLRLEGQEGGSAGETLCVAYAFLSTLFNRTEQYDLPFVVDSPANPIDLAIRTQIADLVPRLSHQFIAFTISSERERFVDVLERKAQEEILYLTLFRKGPGDLEGTARETGRCEESLDGMLVADRDFFRSFQLDTEE